MRAIAVFILSLPAAQLQLSPLSAMDSPPVPVGSHLRASADLGEVRGLRAEWENGALRIFADAVERYAWAIVPAPSEGWPWERRAAVEAQIANTGPTPVHVMLWVVGDRGWDAVPDRDLLAPGQTLTFSCPLREAWPDGTPKLNPSRVKQIQIMLTGRVAKPVSLEVRDLVVRGEAPPWRLPPGRLEVPPVENASPAPGRRVRFFLPGDENTGIYSILNLPEDWLPGRKFPVIAEYPGNIFFVPGCYSTGLPDQCVIGYGMSRGEGAISLALPFIDRETGTIAEHGWGNPDHTADYAVRLVEEVCSRFGGDRANVVLTGFSRGALACGYIGLRNERVAALWKGFHACQHYDGDGWNGATLEGALERAARFRGQAVFQTDNSPEAFQPVMDAMRTEVTWAKSQLGAHATAMFLDDRPSTQELRRWFSDLVRRDE